VFPFPAAMLPLVKEASLPVPRPVPAHAAAVQRVTVWGAAVWLVHTTVSPS